MSTVEHPLPLTWMDKKMLEKWLRPHYGDLTVTDLEVKAATAKGDNYLSNMQRIKVTAKDGHTYSLLVKCRIEEGPTANILKDSSIFNKEHVIYSNIMPKMHALLQRKMPESYEPITPKSIFSCKNFLVMEDLSVAGFKMEERRNGLDLEHCLLVMKTVAKFHAASAVLYDQDPECMKDLLVSYYRDPAIERNWKNFYGGIATTLADELDSWPQEWKRFADKLRRFGDNVVKKLQIETDRDDSGFNVLTHCDLWVNNILFRDSTNSVRIVDFQCSQFTSPAIDLQYFLATSLPLEVRINHSDDILKEYHATLCETLTALDYKKNLITLHELKEEFEKKTYYGFFSSILHALMLCDPECNFTFDQVLSTGKTPGIKMLSEDFKKEVKWFLPMYDKKGILDDL